MATYNAIRYIWGGINSTPENQILVQDELINPLPLIEKTAKSLRGAGVDDHGMVRPRAKHCLDIRIGKESIERAARIMDILPGCAFRFFYRSRGCRTGA